MVNLEELTLRGLRAYEYGRLRTALRVVVVLTPAVVLCALEARTRADCLCVGALLLGLCVWLRWRDRDGFEAVTSGLLAGGIPLIAGLVLARVGVQCSSSGSELFCLGFSGMIGLVVGAVIAVREARRRARVWSVLTAVSISALAASLGCLRLGIASVLAILVGTALGAMIRPGRRGPTRVV